MLKNWADDVGMMDAAIEYIRSLEKTWGATVKVEICADGALYAGTCAVEVRASVPSLKSAGRCYQVRKYDTWPRSAHQTIGALIYQLCHQVDVEIGSVLYKQQELPF